MKQTIYIVGGTGRMGTFLLNFLKSGGFSSVFSGRALKTSQLSVADIIFISVPISVSSETIKKVSAIAKKDAVIINMSSVMSPGQKAFKEIKQPGISMHFLFGPTVSSVKNQTVVVGTSTNTKNISFIITLLEKAGAQVIFMDPDLHDKEMAVTQNLVHFINLALSHTVKTNASRLITPVFLAQLSAMNRVINQEADLLSEIQRNNPYGTEVIQNYLAFANSLIKKVKSNNAPNLSREIFILQKDVVPHKQLQNTPGKKSHLNVPKTASVAYLGPQGTYSYMAAKTLSATEYIPSITIREVFQKVEEAVADFGVVPAQNTIHGAVHETFDLLYRLQVKAIDSVYLPIHHSLVSKEQNMRKIKTIYSHPQALAQCRSFIEKNMPGAKINQTASTLSALPGSKNEKGAAFIVPPNTAEKYGMKVLRENIGDFKNNTTRFFVITQANRNIPHTALKTLILLSIYNRVGVLRDILTVFANENINLSNIESRPSMDKNWDYNFFVEVDIPQDSPRLTESLNILRQYCPEIKILGGVS